MNKEAPNYFQQIKTLKYALKTKRSKVTKHHKVTIGLVCGHVTLCNHMDVPRCLFIEIHLWHYRKPLHSSVAIRNILLLPK